MSRSWKKDNILFWIAPLNEKSLNVYVSHLCLPDKKLIKQLVKNDSVHVHVVLTEILIWARPVLFVRIYKTFLCYLHKKNPHLHSVFIFLPSSWNINRNPILCDACLLSLASTVYVYILLTADFTQWMRRDGRRDLYMDWSRYLSNGGPPPAVPPTQPLG